MTPTKTEMPKAITTEATVTMVFHSPVLIELLRISRRATILTRLAGVKWQVTSAAALAPSKSTAACRRSGREQGIED